MKKLMNFTLQKYLFQVQVDTVWKKKGSAIYMGKWCQLTGFWFWSKIATCGCSQKMCMFS